jgi:hypothetical protein
VHHCILDIFGPSIFFDEDTGDELGISGGGEEVSPPFKLLPELLGIHQIPIMSEGEKVVSILKIEGLSIFWKICTCGGISDMSHANISLKAFQHVLVKDFGYQPFTLIFIDFSSI